MSERTESVVNALVAAVVVVLVLALVSAVISPSNCGCYTCDPESGTCSFDANACRCQRCPCIPEPSR